MSDLTNSQADVQLGVDGRADRRAFLLAGLMATAGIATGSKSLWPQTNTSIMAIMLSTWAGMIIPLRLRINP